jgi:hypothetical protein
MRKTGAIAVAFHAVSEPPSRLRRVLRAVAIDAGLLRRRRDYRLLVGGQFVLLAGSELTFVAVPFQTFQRHVDRHGRSVALAGMGWGVAIVGFGFAEALGLALVCLAVTGGDGLRQRPLPQHDLEQHRPRAPARPAGAGARPRAHAAVIRNVRPGAQCSTARHARRSRTGRDV